MSKEQIDLVGFIVIISTAILWIIGYIIYLIRNKEYMESQSSASLITECLGGAIAASSFGLVILIVAAPIYLLVKFVDLLRGKKLKW